MQCSAMHDVCYALLCTALSKQLVFGWQLLASARPRCSNCHTCPQSNTWYCYYTASAA